MHSFAVLIGKDGAVNPDRVDAQGTKHPLGIWEGATENKVVCARALANLGERGLCADDGLLVGIDGSKALRAAIRDAFGERAQVQRCRLHKAAQRARPPAPRPSDRG